MAQVKSKKQKEHNKDHWAYFLDTCKFCQEELKERKAVFDEMPNFMKDWILA